MLSWMLLLCESFVYPWTFEFQSSVVCSCCRSAESEATFTRELPTASPDQVRTLFEVALSHMQSTLNAVSLLHLVGQSLQEAADIKHTDWSWWENQIKTQVFSSDTAWNRRWCLSRRGNTGQPVCSCEYTKLLLHWHNWKSSFTGLQGVKEWFKGS